MHVFLRKRRPIGAVGSQARRLESLDVGIEPNLEFVANGLERLVCARDGARIENRLFQLDRAQTFVARIYQFNFGLRHSAAEIGRRW